MRQNYKRLGDYIRLVDVRNKNLDVQTLLGVSIQKKLMPSIANTVGTDMSNYKIIQRNQFAYGTVTSRNGDKISIALLKEFEKAIVSQIYLVFEIKDTAELLPDYLMMWFRRPEFDRYARFKSHGSARETFDWNEMIETELPIPGIEKQKELIAEYQTIENRIRLNNELCEKLEETAQTVYRHWFEDFEFPVIARGEAQQNDEAISTNHILQVAESTAEYQNRSELVAERSRSYKSSGGKMVYNEELGKEIPEGWKVGKFTDIVKISGGGTPKTEIEEFWNGTIPFFTPKDYSGFSYTISTEKNLTNEGLNNCSSRLYNKNTTFVTARGTVGNVALAGFDMAMNQSCYALLDKESKNYFYVFHLSKTVISKIKNEVVGAVFSALVTSDFANVTVAIPPEKIIIEFEKEISRVYNSLLLKAKQNQKLEELKSLLLGKMAVEG